MASRVTGQASASTKTVIMLRLYLAVTHSALSGMGEGRAYVGSDTIERLAHMAVRTVSAGFNVPTRTPKHTILEKTMTIALPRHLAVVVLLALVCLLVLASRRLSRRLPRVPKEPTQR